MNLHLIIFIFAITFGVSTLVEASSVPEDFTPEGLYSHFMKELNSAQNTEDRFYALTNVALPSYEFGKTEDAMKYANELLKLADSFQSNWNYGNAIHKGNIALGRIALTSNKVELAKEYLYKAGNTPGSPQLNSFGPNMTLAKELLERSEKDAVKKYLIQCGKFWKNDNDKLEFWSFQIDKGRVPRFGTTLLY